MPWFLSQLGFKLLTNKSLTTGSSQKIRMIELEKKEEAKWKPKDIKRSPSTATIFNGDETFDGGETFDGDETFDGGEIFDGGTTFDGGERRRQYLFWSWLNLGGEKRRSVCGLIWIEEKVKITVQCTGCEQLTVCSTVFLTLTTKQYSLILLLIIQLFLV